MRNPVHDDTLVFLLRARTLFQICFCFTSSNTASLLLILRKYMHTDISVIFADICATSLLKYKKGKEIIIFELVVHDAISNEQ